VFGIPEEQLFGIATIKGSGFNFALKQPQTIDLAKYQEFSFTIEDDKYKGHLLPPEVLLPN